ncbi:hypothetical protein ACFLQ0_05490 [Nitrospinota bacterium]
MTIDDLTSRFPEIPGDLHSEPVLAEFAEAFGAQLAIAEKPVACSAEQSAGNVYYMKLINPIGIYAIGLAKKEMVLAQLQELVDGYKADPEGFAASLLPENVSATEVRGPGCN